MANNDRMQALLNDLPWYIGEYIEHKSRKLSAASLLNYCHDYKIFFTWIKSEGIADTSAKDTPLELLESLTVQQMDSFLLSLKQSLNNKAVTVNRKLSSLKSLFNYLQNIAETSDLQPYLKRNVMAKLEFNEPKESKETNANKMAEKILIGDDYEGFLEFVANGYEAFTQWNKKLGNSYRMNRERDTAIVSLILGSGLRLSEVVGLNLTDLDLENSSARVIRKGNKEQYVFFNKVASDDLQRYLAIRKERYGASEDTQALFVAASRRLSARAVEKLIEKYATAFGKPELSVHKLRHSFATKYHSEVNDLQKLRRQLGHTSIQTTTIYTHVGNEELRDAVDRL